MKIRAIKITNFLGIDELDWNPSKSINILEGPKGSGKTSVIESIEKGFSNQGRRTELIRHGEDEATLYIETDSGLEIDRRIRDEKSDYLRLKQEGGTVESTERELRRFLRGDIFRPLDFINLGEKEQTEIILGMIQMDYDEDQVTEWFGELPDSLNWDKHVLQILKDIEVKFYAERQEVNREIKTLKAQIEGIRKSLPDNYDGDKWAEENVQDYYKKVSEAEAKNKAYESAKNLREGYEDRIKGIKGEAETAKADILADYRNQREAISGAIDISEAKIKEAQDAKVGLDRELEVELKNVDTLLAEKIRELEEQAKQSKQFLKDEFAAQKERKDRMISSEEAVIAAFNAELKGLDEKERLELEGVNKETNHKIALEEERLGKAKDYLETAEPIDVEPLQTEADKVAEMKGYLREWDRMTSIRDNQLDHREARSEALTSLIETARSKPSELITKHPLPIEGITVDEDGRIRINQTLLDGLSDGEKLEVAIKIAMQRMGELRVLCLDGFEKLNKKEQTKLLDLCTKHDIQAFVTITKDTESGQFEIKQS